MAKGDLFYAGEKLHQAVSALASSPDGIHKRLEYALEYVLRLDEALEWPGDIGERIREIHEAATAVKDEERGHIPATLSGMTDGEASALAEKIVELNAEVSMYPEAHGAKG